MQKIPTLFQRDLKTFKVINEVKPGCEWVLNGEGIATEKLDGMNVRVTLRAGTVVRIEKRRNPNKEQKQRGIVDGWYADVDYDYPGDDYIVDAVRSTDVSLWPDGEHPCEAVGEKIQGNPYELTGRRLYAFTIKPIMWRIDERSFDDLRQILVTCRSTFAPVAQVEGIVFRHFDGRMVKIKRRDFV